MLQVNKKVVSLHRSKQNWCRSSVWLECLPVTQEVDGSSPFGTANKEMLEMTSLFCFKDHTKKSGLWSFEENLQTDFSYGLYIFESEKLIKINHFFVFWRNDGVEFWRIGRGNRPRKSTFPDCFPPCPPKYSLPNN